jgi:hypothetical protein
VAVTTTSSIVTGASLLLAACSGEKLTKEMSRTKNRNFFMELLLSPSGIK